MIHTDPGTPILELAKWLIHHDFNPEKIVFCHMNKSFNLNLHKELAHWGSIEHDSTVREEPSLQELSQVLHEQGLDHKILFEGDLARKSYWQCYGGKPGLKYLVSELSDEFNKLKITSEMLDSIWVKNPQRLFAT